MPGRQRHFSSVVKKHLEAHPFTVRQTSSCANDIPSRSRISFGMIFPLIIHIEITNDYMTLYVSIYIYIYTYIHSTYIYIYTVYVCSMILITSQNHWLSTYESENGLSSHASLSQSVFSWQLDRAKGRRVALDTGIIPCGGFHSEVPQELNCFSWEILLKLMI